MTASRRTRRVDDGRRPAHAGAELASFERAASVGVEVGLACPDALTPAALGAIHGLSGNRSVLQLLSTHLSPAGGTPGGLRTASRGANASDQAQGVASVQRAFEPATVSAGMATSAYLRAALAGYPRVPDAAAKIGPKLKNRAAIEVDWAERNRTGEWVRARVGDVTGWIRVAKVAGGEAHGGKSVEKRSLQAAVVALTGAALPIPRVRSAKELLPLVKAYDDPDFDAMYIARGGPARGAELSEVHGFRDPGTNEIILRTGRQDMDNLMHELLHQHSQAALTDAGGVIANEGTTEYFRMEVLTKAGSQPAPPGPGYQAYLDVMTRAAGNSTDVLSAAYFEGNLEPLKASILGKVDAAYQEFKDAYTDLDGETRFDVADSWEKKVLDAKFATAWEAWLWLIKTGKRTGGTYVGLLLLTDAKEAWDPRGLLDYYKNLKAEKRAGDPAAAAAAAPVAGQALMGGQEGAESSVQRHESAPEEEERSLS